MRVVQDQVFGLLPNFFMQYRPSLCALPTIFNISGDCVVGNSSGFGLETVRGTFGEYIERFHFYNEVKIDMTARLAEVNPETDANQFLHAINQMKQTQETAETYMFDLTETQNIFTGEPIYVPTTLLTLAQGDSLDRHYIPFIDSCGQAVHITEDRSVQCAFNEFVERQALVSAWLAGSAGYEINLPATSNINGIYSLLTKHGRLVAYDLNRNLPGYSIIIFYFSHSAKDSVQYSVGMASDGCAQNAFLRALNEVWQSYIFIYLNAEKSENLDDRYEYLNQLLVFNHVDTENIIPFHRKGLDVVSLEKFFEFPTVSLSQSLQEIQCISTAIYAYKGQISLFGRKFNYSKVLSPDFFLHMGITKPLNFKNKLADRLNITISNKISQAIPFP